MQAGLRARFASPQVADRLALLRELKARNAPETADWMLLALRDPEIAVQKLAYRYLSEQFSETAETALADYAHYQLFEPIATLTESWAALQPPQLDDVAAARDTA